MNAEQLADMLVSKEVLLVDDGVCEAAAMLRKQDAAIKQLREALQFLLVTAHVSADEKAKAALAATEEFK